MIVKMEVMNLVVICVMKLSIFVVGMEDVFYSLLFVMCIMIVVMEVMKFFVEY